jgi:membrane protease YdiL (CAAX protease family)
MIKQTVFQKLLHFFLIKIIIGIAVVGGSVALMVWAGKSLLDKTQLSDDLKNVIIAFSTSAIAIFTYTLLFKSFEKRKITELSLSGLAKNAVTGFGTGLILQSLFILVIWIIGSYSIVRINPVSFLILPFTTAITAGFVSETLIRGIFFRLIEEKLGTIIALFILTLLFGLFHINVRGGTPISVASTALQAGFLLSAGYVLCRSLWFTIFLHFAWDFAEPGIFGAINPGNMVNQSLLTSKITGSVYLTGGQMGPQNSIQAIIFCSITGFLFLWLATQKKKLITPYWRNKLVSA